MLTLRLRMAVVLAAGTGMACLGCSPPPAATPPAMAVAQRADVAVSAGPSAKPPPRSPDASDVFFARETVTALEIEIAPVELVKLRENNRTYIRCRLMERDGDSWSDVALKLKGAAGSFREFDDKPALTLNMRKFKKGQAFHDIEKFHLNNSVQDETYLNEILCSELCRAAGVPAPRVAHARVRLNGREAGLYVLKEGFDKKFLARHFKSPAGNLYDGGFCQEIDGDLERDEGQGPDDHADLRALRDACQAPDHELRWKQLDQLLDVDAFLAFTALELMTGHWDGYCLNRNNYRLYFDPTSHQAHFFPHGMDQMFGDPGASILEWPGALVAATVMQNPDWRSRYRKKLRELLPLFSPPDALLQRVDVLQKVLQPALQDIDPQLAHDHADRVGELKERLMARAASLKEQSEQSEPPSPQPPQPLAFGDDGAAELPDWELASESEDAGLEVVDLPDERRGYIIRCGPGGTCIASWRRRVLLSQGDYRLMMAARTTAVVPLTDEKGSGAGLRISGAARPRGLEGTAGWQQIEYRFRVDDEQREIVLVAELRAREGEVCFDANSPRLFRVSDGEE